MVGKSFGFIFSMHVLCCKNIRRKTPKLYLTHPLLVRRRGLLSSSLRGPNLFPLRSERMSCNSYRCQTGTRRLNFREFETCCVITAPFVESGCLIVAGPSKTIYGRHTLRSTRDKKT